MQLQTCRPLCSPACPAPPLPCGEHFWCLAKGNATQMLFLQVE